MLEQIRQATDTKAPLKVVRKVQRIDDKATEETRASWERIRDTILLPSANQFDERHSEPYGIDPCGEEFYKRALAYYLDHAARFGLDERGKPRMEQQFRETLDDMKKALEHLQSAYEGYHNLPE